ncbi:MAG: hypothetical protein HMLKMBBP_00065 [Planctomycetes bacterium]|nr:hypothetical protein [Planctomycetota bacterium]
MSGASGRRGSSWAARAAGAVVVVAVVAATSWHVAQLPGFVGWDAYPAIDGARAGGDGFLGALSRPFMGSHHPYASFFRPVTSLSIALDHALFGLDAAASGAMTLVWHACAALLLGAWLASVSGSRVAAVAGAALFALHPVHAETLPYLARRGSVLCLLFGLAALVAAERRGARRAAVFCVLAAASQEAGVVFAPLVMLRASARGIAPGRMAAWLGAGIGAYLFMRLHVLGGWGGYLTVDRKIAMSDSGRQIAAAVLDGGSSAPRAEALARVLPLAAAVVCIACVWMAQRSGPLRGPGRLAGGGAAVAAGLATFLAFHTLFGLEGAARYAYVPAAFLCGGLGWAGTAAIRGLRESGAARWVGGVAAAASAMFVLTWIAALADGSDRAMVRSAAAAGRGYLDELEKALSSDPVPERLAVGPSPAAVRSGRRMVLVLAPYSVRAWSSLTGRGAWLRVVNPDDPGEPANAGPPGARTTLVYGNDVLPAETPAVFRTSAGR